MQTTAHRIRVTALYVYPLKGAAGLSLDEAHVEARGLRGDRRWMLVDADGRFLSQRSHPRLALVQARLGPEGIELHAPGLSPLYVRQPAGGRRIPVRVWRDEVEALLADDAAHAWCRKVLGGDARLVFQPDDSARPVDPAYGQAGDYVSFADGFPILLANTASLGALNARLAKPLPMNRFRPNLVVSGAEAFAEDGWGRLQVGAARLRSVKRCGRCVVTTVDQARGVADGPEPLRTLATFRKQGQKVFFGQNLIPDGPAVLRVGDHVALLEEEAAGTEAGLQRRRH